MYSFLQFHMCFTIILQQDQQEVYKTIFKKSGWVTQFLSVKIEMLAGARTLLFGQKLQFYIKDITEPEFQERDFQLLLASIFFFHEHYNQDSSLPCQSQQKEATEASKVKSSITFIVIISLLVIVNEYQAKLL